MEKTIKATVRFFENKNKTNPSGIVKSSRRSMQLQDPSHPTQKGWKNMHMYITIRTKVDIGDYILKPDGRYEVVQKKYNRPMNKLIACTDASIIGAYGIEKKSIEKYLLAYNILNIAKFVKLSV